MKDIVVACCRVAQKNPNLVVDEQSKDFWKWRDTILQNEDVLLEVLCFDLTVDAPHKQLYDMLKFYGVQHNKQLRNAAWAFVTDSNQTQLCLVSSSRTIAAAALYAAARTANLAFPDTRGLPWWEVQHVRLKNMLDACNYMAANYDHAPSKEGSQSIYVGLRTPEPFDGHLAAHELPWERTRLKSDQAITSPTSNSVNLERSRRNSGASSQGNKRPFDAAIGHDPYEDQDAKRTRTFPPVEEIRHALPSNNQTSSAPPSHSLVDPKEELAGDDGSEEGEVEE